MSPMKTSQEFSAKNLEREHKRMGAWLPGLACCVFFAWSTSSAQAQNARQFSELTHLPYDWQDSRAIAAGDLDGDGDQDLVVGNTGHFLGMENQLLLNDGSGRYVDATTGRLPVQKDNTYAVLLVDVDGDRDLDILLGNIGSSGAQNRILLNDGKAKFKDVTSTHLPAHGRDLTTSLAIADIDGDGDLDLAVGNTAFFFLSGRQNRLYLNDGKGTFKDVTATQLPQDGDLTTAILFADVDGDGDQDLITGNTANISLGGAQNRLYLNNGKGVFKDATAQLPQAKELTTSLGAADVNGDGAIDLVVGTLTSQSDKLLINDGKGRFKDVTAQQLPKNTALTYSIGFMDVDRDKDLDLVLGKFIAVSNSLVNGKDLIYLNDGKGKFTDDTGRRLFAKESRTKSIAIVDVNGDGDLDLVVGNQGQNKLLLNDGKGVFEDVMAPRLPERGLTSFSITAGDVDGDGDPDLVVGNQLRPNELYLNDGRGNYKRVTETHMPKTASWGTCHALGDIDGDGDLDLVVGSHERRQDHLFINDGKGRFTDQTSTRLPTRANRTRSVAFGDIDNDGDLDLLLGEHKGSNRIYVNDGKGRFSDESGKRLVSSGHATTQSIFIDVDGDKDLDIVSANGESASEAVTLNLNNGSGVFKNVTTSQMPNAWESFSALTAGDIDGDGDADLVLGGWSFNNKRFNRIYLNDGKGKFVDGTSTRLAPDKEKTTSVVLGDVDQDGDLDLMFGNETRWDQTLKRIVDGLNELYLNDGKGRFKNATAARMPTQKEQTRKLLLLDVDKDGDLDLIVANIGQSRLHLNRHRHSLSGQNFKGGGPASWSAEYSLEFFASYGYAKPGQIVVPCLALGTGNTPILPFGTLGLDLATLVVGPPLSIPAPLGYVSVRLQVSDATSLIGRKVFVQGFVIPSLSAPPRDWHFTNTSRARAR